MNKRIRILPDLLINKIKAGEVIESPLSVVKELVENSIDANSSEIDVSIAEGGLDEILVSDNGDGMSETDSLLCIQRHATSKLTKFSDFDTLETMGFRGEALAAISSISKMEIITKTPLAGYATRVYCEESKIVAWGSAARECGTSIRVCHLFYNVPARKNFQKSTSSLIRAVSQELRKIAIAYPEINFSLSSDKKSLWRAKVPRELPIEDLYLYRIKELLHNNLVNEGFPIDRIGNSFTIWGITSAPTLTRINKKEQYLIVNRRVVFCEEIEKVLHNIYGTLIPSNRFPCFVLYLTLPPHCIDVNVHPQKRFIKIKVPERARIQKFISESFTDILYRKTSGKPMALETSCDEFLTPASFCNSYRLSESPPKRETPYVQLTFSIKDQIIGIFSHYLLLQSGRHLLLFDVKAAEQFLQLTRIRNAITKRIAIESQSLLLPITLEWSFNEFEWLRAQEGLLKNFGFLFEWSPPNVSKIIAVPSCLDSTHVKDWLVTMMKEEGTYLNHIEITLAKQLMQFTKKKSIFTVLEAEALFTEVERVSSDYPGLLGFSLYSELTYESVTRLFRAHLQTTNPLKKE